ncbi:MAG TPA: class I SAM-dependent methyltransferase [Actinomycetes bacterium]|nr:class I SAM-dependent methyltransferase [Actinomycetes bacterium]
MAEHDPTAYGRRIADEYDEHYEGYWDTEGCVARLAELAGDGPVLELGVGTGRLALPLADRGLDVHGLDSSEDMLDLLRAKPGADRLTLRTGDFAEIDVPGTFSLVVLAINTIFALPDQDTQVRCFEAAGRRLEPGGRFAVEAWIPQMERFTTGSAVNVRILRDDRVSLDIARIDPVTQRMETTQVSFTDGNVRLYPANHRYAWPSELDLMARLAGMELESREEDWRGTPFTAHSTTHVSVYRKP